MLKISKIFFRIDSLGTIWAELREANRTEPYFLEAAKRMKEASKQTTDYQLQDGLFFFEGQAVNPPKSPLKDSLLNESHNLKIGGHLGVPHTYKRIAQGFNWSQ